MKKKAVVVAVFACLCLTATFAQNGFRPVGAVDEFKKQLRAASESLHTLECRFSQTKHLDMLDEDVVSGGRFFYKKDHRICMDYETPVRYQLVITRQEIRIASEGKTTVYDTGKNRMMAQMNALLAACMTGNLNDLETEYRLEIEESNDRYRVLITPLSAKQSLIRSVEIRLDRKDFSVQRLLMVESSNDSTVYVFSEQRKNVAIPDSTFNI
jgi:outer membrane lipoprotein-sorting protein